MSALLSSARGILRDFFHAQAVAPHHFRRQLGRCEETGAILSQDRSAGLYPPAIQSRKRWRMKMRDAASPGFSAAHALDAPVRRLRFIGGCLLLALPIAMWIANRSAPLMLGLSTLALLAAALLQEGARPVLRRLAAGLTSPIGVALTLFLLWALLSVSWSHRIVPGLSMWGELALPVLCGLALATSRQLSLKPVFYRAFATMLALAALLMIVELNVGLSQRVALGLGKAVHRTDVFNRPVLTSLLLSAAVLPALWRQGGGSLGDRILCLVTIALVAAATFLSESGAAKLGLLIMLAVWAIAALLPRLCLAAVALGFAATMLTAPVIGELADRAMPAKLHQQLASSHSRARVDIWLTFGDAIRVHPLVGSGFGATAALENHPVAQQVSPARREMLAVGHPHSAPIQAWAETGAVGAALLGFAGLACLWRLRKLAAAQLAPRLALFAATFGVASVAHGAWQGWWIASIATAVALLWLERSRTGTQDNQDG
jgi:O-antigen ligase